MPNDRPASDRRRAAAAPASTVALAADRLHSAAIHVLRRVRVRDRESGVGPAQLSALSVLVFGGPMSLAELAAAEQVRPPSMSRVVSALVRSRLVRRQTDASDRRVVRIEATERGTRLLQEARTRRIMALAAAIARLPARDVARLRAAAEAMERLSAIL